MEIFHDVKVHVSLKHRFKSTKIFCLYMFRLKFGPCVILYFISFLTNFGIICMKNIVSLKFDFFFPVAHVSGKQAATEWPCIKPNKKL